MVSTQDVSFGTMWIRLVGDRGRWDAGDDEVAALQIEPAANIATSDAIDGARFGQGLVAVWVRGEGPVLICDPHKGLRALKTFEKGTSPDVLRAALRDAGAVKHEDPTTRG